MRRSHASAIQVCLWAHGSNSPCRQYHTVFGQVLTEDMQFLEEKSHTVASHAGDAHASSCSYILAVRGQLCRQHHEALICLHCVWLGSACPFQPLKYIYICKKDSTDALYF